MVVLLVLLVIFLSFKKSFPLLISLLFLLNYNGIPYGGVGNVYISYLFAVLFMIIALYHSRSMIFDINLRLAFMIIVFYLIYLLVLYATTDKGYKAFFQLSLPLVLQFYIFSALVYFKKYGIRKFIFYVFIVMLLFIIVFSEYLILPFQDYGILGLEVYHAATIGFAASIIIGYIFYIKDKPAKFDVVLILTVSLLPLLGMSRGGFMALLIVFLSYVFYKKVNIKTTFVLIFLLLVLFLGNYLVNNVLPRSIIYSHLGASSLSDLFLISENINDSIGLRVLRWDFLTNIIYNNPIWGGGIYLSTVSSRMSVDLFKNVWGGHNFFLSILASVGFVTSLPVLALNFIGLKDSLKIFVFKKNKLNIFGAVIILNVFNINFTNTYYSLFWSGPMIWVLFALGLVLIKKSYE